MQEKQVKKLTGWALFWISSTEKRMFNAAPRPKTWSFPQRRHFSQPTQSIRELQIKKSTKDVSFNQKSFSIETKEYILTNMNYLYVHWCYLTDKNHKILIFYPKKSYILSKLTTLSIAKCYWIFQLVAQY